MLNSSSLQANVAAAGGSGGSFGSLTGVPSDNAALAAALGDKLNLTGGALTGALSVTLTGLGTTPTAGFTLANSTAATSGNQQVSPSFVLEGQGWKTNATAASQIVRFRQNVLPVQGSANPSATWQLQSEINNSATWTTQVSVDSGGTMLLAGGIGLNGATSATITRRTDVTLINFFDQAVTAAGIGYAAFKPGLALGSLAGIHWANDIPAAATDIALMRDAAGCLALRNGGNGQTLRIYGTYTDASNQRRINLSMSTAGVAVLKAEGAGTGASGNVIHISTLPTSNPGAGILWNNAGTPAIGT